MTTRALRIALLGPANSIHLQRWAAGLSSRGHAVCVVSQHPCDQELLPSGVETFWLPHRGTAGYFLNAFEVRRFLGRWRPDILNTHYASGYGSSTLVARRWPSVLSVWGSDVYSFPYQGRLQAWLVRANLRRADVIASTSEAMARQVRRLTPERQAIAITPFGVDIERFSPRGESQEARIITIGIVKALAPQYGIDLLLRAFARLIASPEVCEAAVECRLLIIGEGPQARELMALADTLKISERTRFLGNVSHRDVPTHLHTFDIFAAPSRHESFGVAVVEASACALPAVVSNAGGLSEVVEHGVTGLVVPCDDVAALCEALQRLVLDRTLRMSLGAAARRRVERLYAWEACIERMERVYATTLDRSGRNRSSPTA